MIAMLDANGWVAVIGAIFLGLGQLLTIWLNNRRLAAVHTDITHVKDNVSDLRSEVIVVKDDIHKVEVASNSMKDALVAATEAAAMSVGELKGRADKAAEIKQDAKDAKDARGAA